MTRLLTIFVIIAAEAAIAAAAPVAQVTIDKVVVKPVTLRIGPHLGRISLYVQLTTTKKVELDKYTTLLIKMTCRSAGKNYVDTVVAHEMNKADVGDAQRNAQLLFLVNPLAARPERCTLAFALREGFARTTIPLKTYCYTGEKPLRAKACANMKPLPVAGPQPLAFAR